MFAAFNIIVVLLVAFVAYWWANQGAFSALLHLLCVVVAGAITLAFWEPLTTGLILHGNTFDDYAWGIVFIGLFAISLFVLRVMMDKLAPENLDLPHWANLAFGGVFGAGAGVLTIGLVIIGTGFVQSPDELFGFRGAGRLSNNGAVGTRNSLWIPVHTWTSDFYGLLSVTSLDTRRPLRHYYPDLDRQSTLMRDTYSSGRGKISLAPSEASVAGLYLDQAGGRSRFLVRMKFGQKARDWGEQMTLSTSQVRLIGWPNGREDAPVVHPVAWRQHSGYHKFDDVSHYASSRGSDESAEMIFDFPPAADFTPRFIQIRGTRFALPEKPQAISAPTVLSGGAIGAPTGSAAVSGDEIDAAIRVTNSIRPLSISVNTMPGTISEVDRYLSSGEATFKRGGRRPSRKLAIQGILEPAGSRCVKVDVSRESPANIFARLAEVASDAPVSLVLADGRVRSPIGYLYVRSDGTTIKLDPQRLIRTVAELPRIPTTGGQTLKLLFYVNEGDTIVGLRVGDLDIGRCSVPVSSARSR